MKLRIEKLELIGAERVFNFVPGLNLVTGPITTGKTTLVRCVQGLLGNSLNNMNQEATRTISNLAGQICFGEATFQVVRPFVTTTYAKVDVAGMDEAERLPVYRPTEEESKTYSQWLLEKMGLPVLRVPRAPTRPDSETVPLSASDFMMYCYLRQDEIDNSVFGHTDTFKNIKRKYVFEVVYGKYDIQVAHLQDQRRDTVLELRRLQSQASNIDDFLSGTSFANQASLREELSLIDSQLISINEQSIKLANQISQASDTETLRSELIGLENRLDELRRQKQLEAQSADQKQSLIAQLKSQSARLTKAIVAGDLLLDFDFITCPRCNSSLEQDRASAEVCYLCLQTPEPQVLKENLIEEQDRLGRQIVETRQLVNYHIESAKSIDIEINTAAAKRDEFAAEIQLRTSRYVSEQAERITEAERERTSLVARQAQLRDYLGLFERLQEAENRQAELQLKLEGLEGELEAATSGVSAFNERIAFLEERFKEILDRIQVPHFPNPGRTGIDRNTYLPILEGRRFDQLQSQGLQVMVNLAHAVAHQLTAIHLDLPLPNYLMIDGLSGNIGYEDIDAERIDAMYALLLSLSEEHGERLQIIVTDNTVPQGYRDHIVVELTDENKLIPQNLLGPT